MNNQIFHFEMKKIYKQKRILLLLVLVVFLNVLFFMNNKDNEQLKLEEIETSIVDNLTTVGILHKFSIANNKDLKVQEHLEGMLQQASDMKLAFNQQHWDRLNQLILDYLNSILILEAYGESYRFYNSLIDYEKEIKNFEYLIENKIDLDSLDHPTSSSLLLVKASNFMFSPIGVVLLFLLYGSIFLNEVNNNTIYFLRTQPLKFRKLLASKFLVVISISIGYIFVNLLITYLFSKIIGMSSNWDYPMYFLSGDLVVLTNATNYLLLTIGQFILQIILIFSISFLLKLVTRNELLLFIYTGIVSIIGVVASIYMESLQTAFNPFAIFLPIETIYPFYLPLVFVIIIISMVCFSLVSIFYRQLFIVQTKIVKNKSSKRKRILEPFLNFEWLKIRRFAIFKLLVILFFVAASISYVYIYINANNKEIQYIQTELTSDSEDFFIDFLNKKYDASTNHLNKKRIEEQISYFNESKKMKQKALTNYEKGEFKPLIEYQLRRAEYTLNGGLIDVTDTFIVNYGLLSVDASIKEKEYMLKNEIVPYFPGEFIPTIFQMWGTNVEEYKKDFNTKNTKINDSGLYSLYLFLSNYGYLIIIGILYFLLANTLIKDKNSFIHSQPITFSKIFWSKLLIIKTVTTFTFLSITIYYLIVGTIVNNFGQWKYPILKYDSEVRSMKEGYDGFITIDGAYQFIWLGSYIIQSIILIYKC